MGVAGPDRGYSWVIVFACAYIHFALFGLFRSWGVIYVAVLKDYDVTREEASWPFSLCSAIFQLTGPSVSILVHYVSKRAALLLGSTVATLGVVACYFADSVMWITIFYGVVHGLGFGVVVTLIPVFLNQYFVRHRATALGIAFSGGSVSSFVVPIAMEWLLDNYNLHGSFLLLGGVVMNTLVASALLRPPPWLKKAALLEEASEAKDSGVSTSGDSPKEQMAIGEECQKELDDSVFIDGNRDDAVAMTKFDDEDESAAKKQATVVSNNDSVLFEGSLTKMMPMDSFTPLADPKFSSGDDVQDEEVKEPLVDKKEAEAAKQQATVVSNNDSVLFEGSVTKMYVVADSKFANEEGEVQEPLVNGKGVYIVPKSTKSPAKKKGPRFKFVSAVAEILSNPRFHLIADSMFVFFLALQSFFVVIVDYAKDKGLAETDGVYLMSIFSLTDLCGRSGLGWITDRHYVKRKNMVIVNLILISVIMQLYPVIMTFSGLLAVAACHGLCVGSCITLFFVLQAEYFGLKKLTLVVGLTSFLNGALTLLRPALIGMFRDTIGSYDWMFHSLGLILLVLSFIWLAESFVTRRAAAHQRSAGEKA